jgi:G:T/U-mismatch repair DNA glycosylase
MPYNQECRIIQRRHTEMQRYRRPLFPALLLACGLAAPCAGFAQGARADLRQVLESALSAEAIGPRLAQQASESAAGMVQSAEGAFDWSIAAAAGVRRIAQTGVSPQGFLTDEILDRMPFVTTLFGQRLLENGIKVNTGVLLVNETSGEARRNLNPLANRPQLTFDIPMNSSLGAPPEALRLEAARSELTSATHVERSARAAFLHRVATSFWKMLGAQGRRDAERAQRDVNLEVAAFMAKLSERGEVAAAESAQWRSRAQLRQLAERRAQVDLDASRGDLLALLRLEGQPRWRQLELAGDFPDEAAQAAAPVEPEPLIRMALERRPDHLRLQERVRAADLRTQAVDRENADRVAVVAGLDRVMFEYSTSLGGNRSTGLRRQGEQEAASARANLEDLRRIIAVEINQALIRYAGAGDAVRSLREVAGQLRENFENVRRQVGAGLVRSIELAAAADTLAQASRDLVDARVQYAQAIADLRLATADLSDSGAGAAALASLLRRAPGG